MKNKNLDSRSMKRLFREVAEELNSRYVGNVASNIYDTNDLLGYGRENIRYIKISIEESCQGKNFLKICSRRGNSRNLITFVYGKDFPILDNSSKIFVVDETSEEVLKRHLYNFKKNLKATFSRDLGCLDDPIKKYNEKFKKINYG